MMGKRKSTKNLRMQGREVRHPIADSLQLPKDISTGLAIVTITGRHELMLENYKGILAYDEDCIRIQTKDCKLTVSGCRLKVDYYTNEEMKITGLIQQICYEV